MATFTVAPGDLRPGDLVNRSTGLVEVASTQPVPAISGTAYRVRLVGNHRPFLVQPTMRVTVEREA